MVYYIVFSVIILLTTCQETRGTRDDAFYSAVVVEYAPVQDPSIDGATNILNNVRNYVNLTNIANDKFRQVDIIVFPENGLVGYGNQVQAVEVPDPAAQLRLCATNTSYDAPLVQLSCVARATQTYIVVNLVEKFYNTTLQKTVNFNTDVVFDSNGTIIARYRKIHLFSTKGIEPSPNREVVYFDTSFGVRFGIFTCFDIIFEDPGVILANKFNITHFIFPTEWFSQMPFLTAIQEQAYWSYTQDVVLLAAGYNDPPVGSSGTGVYLGRSGPVGYHMTQTRQTFMMQARVPKLLPPRGVRTEEIKTLRVETIYIPTEDKTLKKPEYNEISHDKITLKQEGFIKSYSSKPISIPVSSMKGFNGTTFSVPFTLKESLCQNDLCCNFSLDVTAVFNKTAAKVTRGDDYSQLFYRLVVFDGVRDYDKVAYGGLQTCAILSCIDSDIASCGLRSDDSRARPNTIYSFFQTDFIFDSISINGNFSSNHSSVGPNVLLTGRGSDFGSLLPPQNFTFSEALIAVNGTIERMFQTLEPIPNLVTASLYGRLFLRDDLPEDTSSRSSGYNPDMCSFIAVFLFFSLCK